MSLPPNEPLFRGFSGLLSLITSSGTGGTVNASDVIGLTAYIENTVATSSSIKETITDFVADSIDAGTGINVTVNDPSDTVEISLDDEYVRDLVAGFVVAGPSATITVTHDDLNNQLQLDVTSEGIQDIVGLMIVGGSGINVSYNDSLGTETISLDMEYVQDSISTFLQPGTNISFSYNDVGNTLTINYLSPETQLDFNDNSTLNVIIGNAITDRASILDYTLESLSDYQVGNIQVVHDGTNAGVRNEFVGVPNPIKQVSFTASVVGNNIVLSLQAVNVGSNLKFKMKNRSVITKTI